MNVMGIEFAPLSLPLERRLQTAAVLYYCTSFLCFGPTAVGLFIYLLFTRFFFIPLLYFAWFVYDHKKCCQGGRRFEWVRRWKLWRYFADYFPVTMVKKADLDPNKNYIFGYHPHGIFCSGAFSCFGTEARDFSTVFPGITPRILTLEGQFWFPLHREHIMCSGACAATRESIEWLLTKEGKGNALILVIGGAAEALDAHPGDVNLTLKRRKGFVRLALKHGAVLLQPPSRKFGECVYSYNGLLSYMKQLLLSFEVIPVDGNALLGTAAQILETPGVAIFWDGLQLCRNITLDVQNVRKSLALQG
ncbi:2-acylglycerol O-acyltransferase 1 [Araneus ventricosus]|uniref:Acyltransferase n=2 Tax=Araneus ventricosus TaxID=182803 RepID=A0A4Y2REP5_ARAVE|nr:2-acylglycerol O-acyltransferase 1 [Araneus ventricosus]